jgi:CubicO group peptidase (beta-lactamase class C family)
MFARLKVLLPVVMLVFALVGCGGEARNQVFSSPATSQTTTVSSSSTAMDTATPDSGGGGSANGHSRTGGVTPPASPTPTPGAPPEVEPPALVNPIVKTYSGVSLATHQANIASFTTQGYQLLTQTMYGTPSSPLFAATWLLDGAGKREKGPAQQFILAVDASALLAELKTLQAEGYQPVHLSAVGSDASSARFSAVLEQGAARSTVEVNLTSARFGTICGASYPPSANNILISAAAYGTRAANLYAGIWQFNASQINWAYYYGQSAAGIAQLTQAYDTSRIRLARLFPSTLGVFTGVWYDNSLGEQHNFYPLTDSELGARIASEAQSGFFPVALDGAGNGSAARFAVIFAKRFLPVARKWTVTGPPAPASFAAFDTVVKEVLQHNGARAAELAIVKDGRLVFAHGYTLAEPWWEITQSDSLFRIASTTKPITSIAVHQLLQNGQLSLTDNMQQILGVTTKNGHAPTAARWFDIQVWELLSHLAGWDAENPASEGGLGFDPMFYDLPISQALGIPLPITKYNVATFMTEEPIQYVPGTTYVYSNFSFSLLGQILEKKYPGLTYPQVIDQQIFQPLGITAPYIGQSGLSDRRPGEVFYQGIGPSIVTSVLTEQQPLVPYIYGGSNITNMDSHGGWVMRAPDYAKILTGLDPASPHPLLDASTRQVMWTAPLPEKYPFLLRGWFRQTVPDGHGGSVPAYWHNGWLDSNANLVFTRPDIGLSVVLFVNEGTEPYLLMGPDTQGNAINDIANGIADWPSTDLFPQYGLPPFQTP